MVGSTRDIRINFRHCILLWGTTLFMYSFAHCVQAYLFDWERCFLGLRWRLFFCRDSWWLNNLRVLAFPKGNDNITSRGPSDPFSPRSDLGMFPRGSACLALSRSHGLPWPRVWIWKKSDQLDHCGNEGGLASSSVPNSELLFIVRTQGQVSDNLNVLQVLPWLANPSEASPSAAVLCPPFYFFCL